MKQDMIVILDLGSTENTTIARQIRELGVYSEIHPHDITLEELNGMQNVKGIILNGGENRIVDGKAVEISRSFTVVIIRCLPLIILLLNVTGNRKRCQMKRR